MRRTLEITSHLLTYRERIYARIHFGAYVHTAAQRTEIRIRIREKSQAVSAGVRTGGYYSAVKFKRH